MPRCKMISLTNPAAGREAEFHDWYQNVHLPELTAMAGVESAQRYQLVAKLVGADPNGFLAIYDIECDDPGAFLASLGEAAQSGRMTPSDTVDLSTSYTALFTEHGERVTAR